MPFQTASQNLIRRPKLIAKAADTPASATPMVTALTAAAAAGTNQLTVASAANFVAGPMRVAAGEMLEPVFAVSIAALVITLARPLQFDHAVDEPVVAQRMYNLGDVDGDVTINVAQESSDQQSAMRLLPFTILRGNVSIGAQFRLLGTTLANLCVALGLPFSKLTGSSTAVDPLLLQTDLTDVDTSINESLFIISERQDGTLVVHELWSLATDYTGVSVNFARAQNGAVPVSVMGLSAFMQYDLGVGVNVPWTALPTYRATKGTVFRELREVGVIEATGATAVIAEAGGDGGDADVGEKPITLDVAIAGLVNGDFVIIDSEDQVEVHQTNTVATVTVTLRTGLLREKLNGTVVQKGVKIPFFTVAAGGVTFNTGGSTTPIPSELRDLPIGMQKTAVQATMSFATLDMLVANVARAIGVPASQVSGGGALLSKLIASRTIVGAYFEGITQSGMFCRVIIWGASQEVQSFALALGAANPAQTPYALRPASGVQFTQWTV
ncbi:MAG: hypothetical protein H7099_15800 [Gemmatimonadaceae bacterium]|nr:hypothetical protein [Gemmatimonadaceae bacterium]